MKPTGNILKELVLWSEAKTSFLTLRSQPRA
jgi:hypothetical protein